MRMFFKATVAAMVLAVVVLGLGCSCKPGGGWPNRNCGGMSCPRCTTGKDCGCAATCVCAKLHGATK